MLNFERPPNIQWHFDFDGTLFFTHEALLSAYSESITENGGVFLAHARQALVRGESYKDFLNLCAWNHGKPDFEDVRVRKNEIYLSKLDLILPNSTLIEAAISLSPNASIVTSSSRVAVDTILAYFNLKEYFENITTSDDVLNIKPHPEPYLKSISRFSNAKHIAVEDSELGVISAFKAGLLVLKVSDFSM
jgi:beta-phosphoglucomutase-like phosphatase (HAD superfamily)